MSTTASRIIRNTGWLYAKMGITMFISLYTTRLILQGLGASDFGIYNIVGGAIAMLGFLNGSMTNATQRFMNYAEGEGKIDNKKIVFNVANLLHIGIALCMILILFIAGYLFFHGILNIPQDRLFASYIVYGSLVCSTVCTIISVPYDAILISHENLKFYALVGIIESFLKLVVAYICIITTLDKLIIYGIFMACIPIVIRIIMRVYCHRKYEECVWDIKTYYDPIMMKKMSSFAGWNFLTSATSLISQYGLGVVLNHFFGTLLNAAQGIANQVSGVLMTISANAMKAINPILFISEGAKKKDKVIYLTYVSSRISFILFAAFSIPLIIMAPIILKLWLVNVPDWAVIFCQLHVLRILLEKLIGGNLASAIYAHGEIRNYTIVKGILNILPIIIVAFAFEYDYPPYTMYLVWIVCWSILGGMTVIYYGHEYVGIDALFYIRKIILPCLFTLLTSGSILEAFIYYTNSWIFYIFALVLFFGIFGTLTWFLIINKEERASIKTIMANYRNKYD